MQKIIIEKPYQFVPAHRGNWWPALIQRFRLIDYWLKKSHGVVAYECRHVERLRNSIDAGHGVLLTPNHCRACDPVAMGFLAREANTFVYAMASWHLYNQDKFTAFSIQKMGGFSVYREGIDRKAINTAIQILETAERPLIIFPEGGVTKTNDRLNALLEGVAFIARTGAKKRKRLVEGGQVVVHPVALKYLLQGDIVEATDPVLTEIERRLSWRPQDDLPLIQRITKVGLSLLTLKEIEYFGEPQQERFAVRLENLIDKLLGPLEQEWLGSASSGPVIPRVKALRMKIMPEMIRRGIDATERERRWRQLHDIYLAQQVASYPHDYLETLPSVDRILETVDRFEEDLTDKIRVKGDLKIVIEVGEAIPVDPRRDRSVDADPLMDKIQRPLQAMLDRLATESRVWDEAKDARTASDTESAVVAT